jgi:Zn-dependent membrane protease YugP
MFYPGGGGLFFGNYWLLYIGVPLIIGLWAQIRVSSAFRKWGEVRASSNITGAEAAREILNAAKIHDVEVVETNDFLGDHYDPASKRLCLSTNVYQTPSVAALGVAAHETGHAIQHAKAYAPLKARMAIVPVTLLCRLAGVSGNHLAGGIRCQPASQDHFATDENHSTRRRSCGSE